MHDITDGIFVPGLNPFGAPLSSCPTDHATIGADRGKQIHFHENLIKLGDDTTLEFASLGTSLDQALFGFIADPAFSPNNLLTVAINLATAATDPILAILCTTASTNLATAASNLGAAVGAYTTLRAIKQNFQSTVVKICL